jgi:hypothetical protein
LNGLRLLANVGDSGLPKQNHHERVEGGILERPFESLEKRATLLLVVVPPPGIHQEWPRARFSVQNGHQPNHRVTPSLSVPRNLFR